MLNVARLDNAQPRRSGSIFRRGESLLVEPPGPHKPRMLPVLAGNAPRYSLVRVVPPMHVRINHPESLGNCIIRGICYRRVISVSQPPPPPHPPAFLPHPRPPTSSIP